MDGLQAKKPEFVPCGQKLDNSRNSINAGAREKEMATHSNVLAWRIPGTGEPGGLPSMESRRVGHN